MLCLQKLAAVLFSVIRFFIQCCFKDGIQRQNNLDVHVQLKVQLDVHVFISILYSSLVLALHVSGAICTHPQEHKL
jgi:hypothetical protein